MTSVSLPRGYRRRYGRVVPERTAIGPAAAVAGATNGRSISNGRVVDSARAGFPIRRAVRAHRRPAAGHRTPDRGTREGHAPPGAARRDGDRQDPDHRQGHRGRQPPDARPGPQQDARRAAVRGVPRLLPGQRGRVLRQLLRLLPARGVPARAATPTSRRTRAGTTRSIGCATRRPTRCSSAATSSSWPVSAASTASARRWTTARPCSGSGPAARTGATPCCATSWISSTSATTRISRGRGSACAGDTLEFRPAIEERIVRVEFFGDEIEKITEIDPLTGELLAERKDINVYPASHYVTPGGQAQGRGRGHRGGDGGARRRSSRARAGSWRARGCASGPRSTWRCSARSASAPGVENYSRHLSRREAGLAPVDPARLLPAGLHARRRRIAHDHPAGRRACTRTTGRARRSWSTSGSGCRPRWTTGRSPSRSSRRPSARPSTCPRRRARTSWSERSSIAEQLDPPDRDRRSADQRPPDRGPDRRPHGGDPAARRSRRAGDRHDADQADGRGPDRLPARARGQGPVPPLRGGHAGARRDPARPSARACSTSWSASTCSARASTCRR